MKGQKNFLALQLAAVCAAGSSVHTAHRSSTQYFVRWRASIAAQTAASALRLEGHVVA